MSTLRLTVSSKRCFQIPISCRSYGAQHYLQEARRRKHEADKIEVSFVPLSIPPYYHHVTNVGRNAASISQISNLSVDLCLCNRTKPPVASQGYHLVLSHIVWKALYVILGGINSVSVA